MFDPDRWVEGNIGLAYHAAERTRHHWNSPDDMEDCQAAAVMGLLEGARKFDPSNMTGTRVGAFAWLYARNAAQKCAQVLRSTVKTAYRHPTVAVAEIDATERPGDFMDTLGNTPSDEDDILTRVAVDTVLEEIAKLPTRQRQAIEMSFGLNGHEPMSRAKIAVVWGVASHYTVTWHLERGMEALRYTLDTRKWRP